MAVAQRIPEILQTPFALIGRFNPILIDNEEFVEVAEIESSVPSEADQRNVLSLLTLGSMYLLGSGVEQDDAKAFECYQKAADKGFASAQNGLGYMYANGRGVEQDDDKAFECYQKAADKGLASAQSNLGKMYANGRGVEQDDAKAIRWLQKAADKGLAEAQDYLKLLEKYIDDTLIESNRSIDNISFVVETDPTTSEEKSNLEAFRAAASKEAVGKLFSSIRKQKGLTQVQVAELVGKTQPTVQGFETGRRDPSLETMNQYAAALGGKIKIIFEPD